MSSKLPINLEVVSEKAPEKTPVKALVKTPVEPSEKPSEKTSEKIIIEIRKNRNITIAELSRIADVTTRSVERNFKKLQESGRLERIGPDKGGHWSVKEDE